MEEKKKPVWDRNSLTSTHDGINSDEDSIAGLKAPF